MLPRNTVVSVIVFFCCCFLLGRGLIYFCYHTTQTAVRLCFSHGVCPRRRRDATRFYGAGPILCFWFSGGEGVLRLRPSRSGLLQAVQEVDGRRLAHRCQSLVREMVGGLGGRLMGLASVLKKRGCVDIEKYFGGSSVICHRCRWRK